MALMFYPSSQLSFENVVFMTIICLSILGMQVYFLFKYLKKSHTILNDAINMLNAGQYAFNSPTDKGFKSLDDLSLNLNKTIDSFKEINSKYQSQISYLEHLVEHIDAGVLSIDMKGKVNLCNSMCNRLLGIKKIIQLDDLAQKHPDLVASIKQSEVHRHYLMDIQLEDTVRQVSIKISKITILGKSQKLVTIHDVSGDLVKTETDAWNRLLKILNHEIFNSVTPLSSLSNTLELILKNEDGTVKTTNDLSNEEVGDIAESVNVIKTRSQNLMSFIDGFKKIAKVPPPKLSSVDVTNLIHQSKLLFEHELNQKGIKLELDTANEFSINIDQTQIEQALINLVSNSIHALENTDQPHIKISTRIEDHRKIIEVYDNGKGIAPEHLDRVFIPFFSTRKGGTGIGLSLSRYLIQLNNASVQIQSIHTQETRIRITFA